MSDESTKNQDLNLDENPEATSENTDGLSAEELAEKNAKEEAELLSDIDSIINEEDPEFLKQLSQIKIDSGNLDLSVMEQILGFNENSHYNLLNFLKRPFEFASNTKIVFLFWIIILIAVGTAKLAWDRKDDIFHHNLFLNSLAELGSEVREFNPNSELEPFYDNLKFAKNLVSISPMHVNLKVSENSGSNPMLAIEVTAEGLSADAIIEIKDREAEFKDMLLRLTEEKTYDELVNTEGKQSLCEQYRDLLNAYLTRGQVRKVLLKSFVIKP